MFSGIFSAMARLSRSFEDMAKQMERMAGNVAQANEIVEAKLPAPNGHERPVPAIEVDDVPKANGRKSAVRS